MQYFIPKLAQADPTPTPTSHTNQLVHLHRRALPSRGQCVAICAGQCISAFSLSKSQLKQMLTVMSVVGKGDDTNILTKEQQNIQTFKIMKKKETLHKLKRYNI